VRIWAIVAMMVVLGCSRRPEPQRAARDGPPAGPPPRPTPRFAAHVERDSGGGSGAAVSRARGGFHSVIVEGRVPAPCANDFPLVQRVNAVESALVLRVSQSAPLFCEPGVYWFAFTGVAEGVDPGRVPVEIDWIVTTADPRGRSFRRVMLQDTVTVLP
jgi:hypothetical protein